MKRWLGLLLLLNCGVAGAADWVVVHTAPEGDQYYYDASKLAISGNEITYWKKVIFKSPYPYKGQQAASALHRERIDCGDHPRNHRRRFRGDLVRAGEAQARRGGGQARRGED